MSKHKKNGFTLVELLAVIVILAIILVIAVPQIISTITESRKGALVSSAKLIASSAESMKLSNQALGIEKYITCEDVSKINEEDYASCIVSFDDDGKAQVTIIGKGKFEGMGICTGTKEDAEVKSDCETDVSCFDYRTSNGRIILTGYKDTCSKDVIIPNKIDNKPVVSIENSAFLRKQLTSVIIPNSVTTIHNWTFQENRLTSVIIPNSVRTIGANAFYNNRLTSVIIPNSVKAIGNSAFLNNQLTNVTIGNSVTTIEEGAFRNNQLESINIPDSVTSIGIAAFMNNQLESINIPNSVKSIGIAAFNNNKLKEEDAFIYKRNSDGTIDNTYVVSYGGAAKDIIIPNSVTTIGEKAFRYNRLTSVIIPDSVTSIGLYAFSDNQLESVTIPNSVISIGTNAFRKTSSSNPNLTSIINTTGNSFDWGSIITGTSSAPVETGTYNGVNVTK